MISMEGNEHKAEYGMSDAFRREVDKAIDGMTGDTSSTVSINGNEFIIKRCCETDSPGFGITYEKDGERYQISPKK